MADFASILSGADPTAAAQAQAYELQRQGELQLGRPDTGIFSGLADVLAGQNLNRVPAMVGDIAQQKIAAQPDLARLLAADNPWAAVAADPTANPIAQAQILSSTPGDVATAKNTAAEAYLRRAQGALALWQLGGRQGMANPYAAPGTAPGASPAPGPRPPGSPTAPPPGSMGGGHYGGALPTGDGGGAAAETADPATIPAGGMAAYVQRLNPTQRAMFLSRMRARIRPPAATAAGS